MVVVPLLVDRSSFGRTGRTDLTGRGPVRAAGLDLRTRLGDVRLFKIIATLGAPFEVTAASPAIETFLPADEESAARLRDLANLGTMGAKADRRRLFERKV
jgi:hypothetical protein